MAVLKQITPFVPVTDMSASVAFFETVLGFDAVLHRPEYAYLVRDTVALRLINSQFHCYIDVQGIDELYASMEPQLSTLPSGRVRAPFNTEYGQREFHVIDLDAFLISFGEAISWPVMPSFILFLLM